MISQWSGKKMRHFAKIILGTFTAALRRSADQPRPTGGQLQDFNKAIRCMRTMSDFYLLTRYTSHTDQTVSYMRKYLQGFHVTKDVFLRFCADKKTKRAAAAAHKTLLDEQTQESVQALTVSETAKARQNNTLQRRDLVDEILREVAHYNFPKIHLISHFAEQIPKFGSLPQYSTDITEYMHEAFKDAYRRGNKVDSLSQIVTTYTRDHTFAMKDLTIRAWKSLQQQADTTTCVVAKPTGSQVYLKLLGKTKMVLNLQDLEHESGVRDLRLATRAFFMRELRGTNSDTDRLLDHEIGAYGALQILVPKLSD